jgi:hypothetical protein
MIARYNRSKATIEHLGLPPYLPLDEAMGLDVAGELVEGDRSGPKLLGSGEETFSGCAQQNGGSDFRESVDPGLTKVARGSRNQTSAVDAEAYPPLPRAAADELGGAVPPGASLSPARASGAGRVTPPDAPQRPREPAQGRAGRGAPAAEPAPARRRATAVGRPTGHVEVHALEQSTCEHGDHPAPASQRFCSRACAECELADFDASRFECAGLCLAAVDYPEGDDADLVHPGSAAANVGEKSEPLVSSGKVSGEGARGELGDTLGAPSRNGRDAGRDAPSRMHRTTRGDGRRSSGFDACARGEGRTPIPVGVLEPKSDLERQERTNPEDLWGEPAREATGSGLASRAPVTFLEQLQAAAERALAEHNWAGLQALQPVIEAEKVRLSNEAAARRDAEPVRLEVVRARRDGGAK